MTDSNSQWQLERLGKYAYIKARIGWRGLSSNEYIDEGPYLVAGNHIVAGRVVWTECDHISHFRYKESWEIALQERDIILSKDGTIGRVAIIDHLPGEATINGTMMLIRARSPLVPEYVYHYLTGETFQKLIDEKVSGSSIPHIFQRDMIELSLPVPPEDEQRAIATILATIDTAIQNAERVIAKQKAIRAGMLDDLLTYGLDENGEPRDPLAHPEQFQESTLGLIPSDWELSDVNIEFDISSGFTLGTHRRPKNRPRPYLRVANIQRERITLDDVLELEASDAEMLDKRLEVGDLLVVEGHANPEEIGRCAIVNPASAGLTYQNHLFRLRAKRLLPQFALAWLNSSWTQDYWRRLSRTSSGLHTINQTMIRAVPVPVPSEDEQKEIAQVIGIQDDVIKDANAHLNKLIAKKKGLMDDLLTGRVRVSDVRLDEVMNG